MPPCSPFLDDQIGRIGVYTTATRPTGNDVYVGKVIFDVTLGYLVIATSVTAGVGTWAAVLGMGVSAPMFGDGSDGSLSTTLSNITLTADTYYNNLTVNNGHAINTDGYRVFVAGTLTMGATGLIQNNGNAAAVSTAGAATSNNTLGIGTAGGNGGTAAGSAGTNGTTNCGSAGGAGGSGSGGAGAAAGTVTAPTAAQGGIKVPANIVSAIAGVLAGASTGTKFNGGSGGGGGGGDGTAGGGGGGGAGVCMVAARIVSGTGTIRARGGVGGNAAGGNRGGGGGGGGGTAILVTLSSSSSLTVSALGGAHGTKQGTGVDGSDGSTGTTYVLLGV